MGRLRSNALMAAAVSPVVAAWIGARRRLYRGIGRALSDSERAVLGRHFSREFLDWVRVARVERIENPWVVRAAARAGVKPAMDLRAVRGMAFGDTVALANGCDADGRCSVLFHELVHVAQYRALGVRRFLSAYARSWLDSGRSYLDIEFEEQAYAMQARFEAGEVFDVEGEVAAGLKGRGKSTKYK